MAKHDSLQSQYLCGFSYNDIITTTYTLTLACVLVCLRVCDRLFACLDLARCSTQLAGAGRVAGPMGCVLDTADIFGRGWGRVGSRYRWSSEKSFGVPLSHKM